MTTTAELEPAATPDDAPVRLPRRVQALVLGLPVVLIALGGWAHRWTNEDAFINFRVIDNLFAGDGPVFNAGERIEAGTSPLWIGMLSVGRALFGWLLPIEWVAVVMCLAAAIAAFVLAGRAARLSSPDSRAIVVPIGPIVVSSVAVVWDFATSGLEMSLVWLWIAACWYILCTATRGGEPSGRWRAAGAAVIGLAPLVRPDLAVMMVCFGVAWFVLVRPRCVAADLGAMLALPVAYQIFRMGYYASVVPNTALAKDASGLHLRQGWTYLLDFVEPYQLWLPVAVIVAVVALRLRSERDARRATATAAMLAAAALHAGYIVAVGGDYMHGRLLLPAFFALGLPAYLVVRGRDLPSLALCCVTGAWALAAVLSLRTLDEPHLGTPPIADWRQMSGATVVAADVELFPTGIDARDVYDEGVRGYLRILEPPTDGQAADELVVTLGSIGIPAYQLGTDVWIIDIGGLAEPLAARTDPVPGRPAGHRKQVDYAWYDARFGVMDGPAVTDAARALECGQIGELMDAVSDDLTPRRFLSNVWHSVGFTRMRIPADPSEAAAEFCPR
jgi:arabinofuranosyltransferase